MEPSGHGFCEGVIAQAYSQVKSEKGADVNDVQQIVMILTGVTNIQKNHMDTLYSGRLYHIVKIYR